MTKREKRNLQESIEKGERNAQRWEATMEKVHHLLHFGHVFPVETIGKWSAAQMGDAIVARAQQEAAEARAEVDRLKVELMWAERGR